MIYDPPLGVFFDCVWPDADPGGGRWGGRPPSGWRYIIEDILFNAIQAPIHHWAPSPGRNPVSAPSGVPRNSQRCRACPECPYSGYATAASAQMKKWNTKHGQTKIRADENSCRRKFVQTKIRADENSCRRKFLQKKSANEKIKDKILQTKKQHNLFELFTLEQKSTTHSTYIQYSMDKRHSVYP